MTHRITKGTTPTTSGGTFSGEGIGFVKVESITVDGRIDPSRLAYIDPETDARLSRSRLQQDDVLFTIAGTIGRVSLVDAMILPANTNQAVAIIRPNQSVVEPRFLYFALRDKSRIDDAKTRVVQSVQANFSLRELSLLNIPLPSILEQRSIVAILGALDDKIELNRKMSATLEAITRALFKSWFVDFDPVCAKAEGRDPGLPAEIAALFPDSFEDSELGGIPKGWSVEPIGALAEIVGGSTPSTSVPAYWDGPFGWVTPKDLAALETPVLLSTNRTISEQGLSTISSGLLPIGALLLSSRAPIGYLAVAELPVAINQGFIAMKAREGISNLFLLRWSESAHDDILARANGSTFLEISKSNFRPIPVVVPAASIMRAFDDIARPLHDRLVLSEMQSRSLVALRDALLPKLISGEVRVSST